MSDTFDLDEVPGQTISELQAAGFASVELLALGRNNALYTRGYGTSVGLYFPAWMLAWSEVGGDQHPQGPDPEEVPDTMRFHLLLKWVATSQHAGKHPGVIAALRKYGALAVAAEDAAISGHNSQEGG